MEATRKQLDPIAVLTQTSGLVQPGTTSRTYLNQFKITTVRGSTFDNTSPFKEQKQIRFDLGVTNGGIAYISFAVGVPDQIRNEWTQQILANANTINPEWKNPLSMNRYKLGKAFGMRMLAIKGVYSQDSTLCLLNYGISVSPVPGKKDSDYLLRSFAVNPGNLRERVTYIGAATASETVVTSFSSGVITQPVLASGFSLDISNIGLEPYAQQLPGMRSTIGDKERFPKRALTDEIEQSHEMRFLALVRHVNPQLYT